MRANRLISLLLLLQRRGRVTAAEVAEELEISVRTARRDLEALAMSGVPVYPRQGRGGGWQLLGGATTDLSGLSAGEARALFVAAGPNAADGPELRLALRKLSAALPEVFRNEVDAAESSIKVDAGGWGRVGAPTRPTHLSPLSEAVLRGLRVELDYRNRNGHRRARLVDPLGLVTKRHIWYLVARADDPEVPGPTGEPDVRSYRVDRVEGVTIEDAPVRRPPGFDLDQAWARINADFQSRNAVVRVRALTPPWLLSPLRYMFHHQVTVLDDGDLQDDGRVEVELRCHRNDAFAAQISGFGSRVELIDPPAEVIVELQRIADELHETYPAIPPDRPPTR